MRHSDTLDKIVGVYLAGLCRRPFRYDGLESPVDQIRGTRIKILLDGKWIPLEAF